MASLLRATVHSIPRRAIVSTGNREFSALLSPIEEFPGIPSTSPQAAVASSTSVTTLANGLTVVTENGSATSTVALTFPNAGSSSESATESGAALVNKFLSFKSGSGLSSALILRNLEDSGAKPFSKASRTSATVGYTAAKDQAPRLIPLLLPTCTFEKWDVRDAQTSAKVETEQANASALTVLTENIYAAAFGAQSSMGKTFYSASAPSLAAVRSFRERAYVLNGAVLSATGVVDHESFVKVAEEGLSESEVGSSSSAKTPLSPFLGGESRIHANAGYTHLALAFDASALLGKAPLLNVVKRCITLASQEAGLEGFAADGLVGIYGGSSPMDAQDTLDALCRGMTTAVSSDVVQRAKILAKAEAVFAMGGGSQSLAEVMARSVMDGGLVGSEGLGAAYDAIEVKDVQGAMEALAKSQPALAAVGDLSSTPYHGSIVSKFG
mmetsp:Transcript_11177/g.20922  ORF Transcript_11177/g.20922 Transcript_11177/m.20922 type:complete len:441 (-) Transcript_11177:204-1526(-)|eukprot:CAMPEP_0176496888 /NCGR_PEP_ID=MMETSP0200_2-20121128/11429_1 /TAXON_ID=947934 /ORGANISM="Chaetoceros sp., Strain GSL56" /LENGTH=440 /DNA_ID=CAMNT_0017894861 /DNA_START=43 /DNA_END=1365 /DNA_ORIENTATION=-